jgi:hypothetical protein
MPKIFCSKGTVVFGTGEILGLVVESASVSTKPLIESTYTNEFGRVVSLDIDDSITEIKLDAIFLGAILPRIGDTFVYAFNQTHNKYILFGIEQVRSNKDVMRATLTGRFYEYISQI